MMLRKILVPIDFSTGSLAALESARALAATSDAELVVLHALELPVMPMGDVPYFSLNVYEELERTERQRLATLVEDLKRKGTRARALFHVGMAAAIIGDCAASEHPDLIVIGTHGRHGFARMFLGSVAERVVRASTVPVLTVRGADATSAAE